MVLWSVKKVNHATEHSVTRGMAITDDARKHFRLIIVPICVTVEVYKEGHGIENMI
jgi:hypothetical protein